MKDEWNCEIVQAPFEVPMTLEVELTVIARVTLTQELLNGIADQYPNLWESGKDNPKELAQAAAYALLNPHVGRVYEEDYWDGVVETLHGIVTEMELSY